MLNGTFFQHQIFSIHFFFPHLPSIVMYLHKFDNEQILKTEIGWCEPWVYTFTNGKKTKFEIMPRKDSISNSHLPDILTSKVS